MEIKYIIITIFIIFTAIILTIIFIPKKKKCIPNCNNKVCGPDGCNGNCGPCIAGYSCVNGNCQISGCVPNCNNKVCGPDGCNGNCGPCNGSCINGQCINTDYSCHTWTSSEQQEITNGESQLSVCNQSGNVYTGGINGNQDYPGCISTCFCCKRNSHNTCSSNSDCLSGFNCTNGQCVCANPCQNISCGTDICGNNCGTCTNGNVCNNGKCICPTNPCGNKQCGTDGCGNSCGNCPQGQLCSSGFCYEPNRRLSLTPDNKNIYFLGVQNNNSQVYMIPQNVYYNSPYLYSISWDYYPGIGKICLTGTQNSLYLSNNVAYVAPFTNNSNFLGWSLQNNGIYQGNICLTSGSIVPGNSFNVTVGSTTSCARLL